MRRDTETWKIEDARELKINLIKEKADNGNNVIVNDNTTISDSVSQVSEVSNSVESISWNGRISLQIKIVLKLSPMEQNTELSLMASLRLIMVMGL